MDDEYTDEGRGEYFESRRQWDNKNPFVCLKRMNNQASGWLDGRFKTLCCRLRFNVSRHHYRISVANQRQFRISSAST